MLCILTRTTILVGRRVVVRVIITKIAFSGEGFNPHFDKIPPLNFDEIYMVVRPIL